MTNHDYKALCAELVELSAPTDSILQLAERLQNLAELANRARALLALDGFPNLTPEAKAAFDAALPGIDSSHFLFGRRALSAFLREAMKQANHAWLMGQHTNTWEELEAIANNLHNPPPSLKEQALAVLDDAHRGDLSNDEIATIRRALEAL
jgi:predicted transcriptional regulator